MSLIEKVKKNTNLNKSRKMWSNGQFQNSPNQIDSLNLIMHYAGPAIWEGMRSYKQADGSTKIWALREHIARLFNSAKILNIQIPYTPAELETACIELVRANGNGDQYIRPLVYPIEGAEKIKVTEQIFSVDIYSFEVPKMTTSDKGLKMAISNQIRSFPQFHMQAKTTQNYAFVYSCGEEARRIGVNDVFLRDNNGHIVETSVANFFIIYKSTALTPPNDGSILPGITRSTVSQIITNSYIFHTHNLPIMALHEHKITPALLYTADEIFLCGTYAEVIPVVEIDGRKVGDGKIGKVTKLIKDQYSRLVRGRTDEKH